MQKQIASGSVAKKVFISQGHKDNKNLHLSDDLCRVCGGNLPKIEDEHELYRSHGRCLLVVTRGSLVKKAE